MLLYQAVAALLALAVCLTPASDAAKILGLFPFPAPSHLIVMTSLTKELAARGHELTVVTPYAQKAPLKNYKEVILAVDKSHLRQEGEKFDMYAMRDMPFTAQMFFLWTIGHQVCEHTLSQKVMEDFIKSTDQQFDLIIVEAFFNECFLGFAHKFNAPIVQVCPFGGTEWMLENLGNPYTYSYMPDFTLTYTDHMTFLQRLHNTLVGSIVKFGRMVYYTPKMNTIIQKFFSGVGNGPVPHLTDMDQSTSLLLLNTHVSLGLPRPYVPSIVEVGGMHIKQKPDKLPEDLQKFLDNAKEGVIYFSMGSNLKGSEMPVQKRDALLQAFSKLKQKVLWKWEEDVLPGQPKNVKLGKWLPQSDLLAHPNVKLFITHGGLLSTQEALFHGVPVVGIPIFGDQQMNMKNAVSQGFGYLLDYHTLDDVDTISTAINTVLSNPSYADNARRISRIFRDQPRTPLENAVFWTEYVLRHKGAPHMRTAAIDLAWYQYYLLDVIAALAAVALAILLAVYLLARTLCRLVCGKKKAAVVAEGKKKR